MRTFLSPQLKRRIQQDPRSLGALAALANLNRSLLSVLMRDEVGIGPVMRVKIVTLGRALGLPETECFREVRRG
jgi:hypothetical protein